MVVMVKVTWVLNKASVEISSANMIKGKGGRSVNFAGEAAPRWTGNKLMGWPQLNFIVRFEKKVEHFGCFLPAEEKVKKRT
jgi:hypothetical protein